MQINQQLVRFNPVLAKEINKAVFMALSVHLPLLVSTNHSLVSENQVK